MKPIINLEEPIGKTVGRRTAPGDALKYGFELQKAVCQLGGGLPIRKGAYRFHSHEEADEWMVNLLARRTTN